MKAVAKPIAGMAILSLLVIAGGSSVCCAAKSPQAEGNSHTAQQKLSEIVQQVVDQHELPGMMGAIVRDGKLIARAAHGVRNLDHPDIPWAVDDKGHLGSCSKAFTATLAGLLVESGAMAWDDTIAGRVPQMADKIDPAFHEITLWQLLTHTGGVQPNGKYWTAGGIGTPENRRQIVTAGLETRDDHLNTGEYLYSNLGYVVAAVMMESATEKSWEELIQQKIFAPLELTNAGFGPPSTEDQVDQPWGHVERDGTLVPTRHDNPPSMGPAGTIHASLNDWAKFVSIHMDSRYMKRGLMTEKTRRFLHTPPGTSDSNARRYAGGWIVVDLPQGGYELQHQGSNTYWLATAIVQPDNGVAILLVSNKQLQPSLPAHADAIRQIRKMLE